MRYVLAVLAIFTLAPASAQTAVTGTIAGTVETLTGGRAPVAGQEVKLTAYVNNAEADWKTATTDARGRFTFTVPTTADRSYVINVKYKGGDYDSQPIAFKPGETRKQLTMRVYEPTTDAGILRVNVHHIIVDVGEGMVQVAELMVFSNPTDRTYIGAVVRPDGKRETLRFSIPSQASQVQYLEGLMECCVFPTETGLIDTMDVKPGTREVAYNYLIPASRAQAVVARLLDYPTDRVEVFGAAAARITATPLDAMPAVETEQGSYLRFSGASLAPKTGVTISLSGLPMPKTSTRRVAIAAFAGIVAAALAYPLLRRRATPGGTGRRSGGPAAPEMSREELIAAAAALDDRYEAGKIPEAEYRQRRARYLEHLKRTDGNSEDAGSTS